MQPDYLNCAALNDVLKGPTCAPGEADCVNWYDVAGALTDCSPACPWPDVQGPPCPGDYTIDPGRAGCCRPVAGQGGYPPRKRPGGGAGGLIPAPCVGLDCGGSFGIAPIRGRLQIIGCAPCEDGHIPSLPDCDCSAAPPAACCIDPSNPLSGFDALSCCVNNCIKRGLNAAQCILGPCANPPPLPPCVPAHKTFSSQTITIGGGQQQQQQCAAGEHPAPCDLGEALDLSTGCCSLPSNILEIGGGGSTLEIPGGVAGGASGAGGGAFQLPPASAESDFLAAIAA